MDLIVQATKNAEDLGAIQTKALVMNTITATILTIDILSRIYKYRFEFLDHILNIADIVLALVNVFILFPFIREQDAVYNWLTFFQIIRVYRIMLIIPYSRHLWKVVLGNIRYLLYLIAFAVLLFISTSLIYARFFEGIISDPNDIDSTLSTMTSFTNVFMTLYIIMTSENWTNVMYLTQETATSTATQAFIFIYLAVWFCIANILLINAFLDLISENLAHIPSRQKKWYQVVNFFIRARTKNIKGGNNVAIFDRLKYAPLEKVNFDAREMSLILYKNGSLSEFLSEYKFHISIFTKFKIHIITYLNSTFSESTFLQFYSHFYLNETNMFHPDGSFSDSSLMDDSTTSSKVEFLSQHPMYDSVFFLISSDNPIRKFIQNIVPNFHGTRTKDLRLLSTCNNNDKPTWREYWPTIAFELFMFAATIVMLTQTCIMTPLYRFEHEYHLGEWNWPVVVDLIFCVIFSVEFLLHVLADGLFFTPTAFLMDGWGILTTITLISMWLDFGLEISNFISLAETFSSLKSLRALRILTTSSVTRETFDSTLIYSIHSMYGAVVTALSLMIPFAIWGLNIFAKRFGQCNDDNDPLNAQQCFGDYVNSAVMCKGHGIDNCGWDVLSPRVYSNPHFNFDSFGSSLSTLFQITSVEGWTSVLNSALRSSGVNGASTYHQFSLNAVFVFAFNIVSTFLILNLFLSELINGYARKMGTAYLTDYQVGWTGSKNLIRSVEPTIEYRPQFNKFQTWLYNFFVEPIGVGKVVNFGVYILLASALLFDDDTTFGEYYKSIVIIFCTTFLLINHVVMAMYGARKKELDTLKRYSSVVLCVVAIILGAINYGREFRHSESGVKLEVHPTESIQKVVLCFFFIFLPRISAKLNTFLRFSVTASKQFVSLMILWVVLFLVFSIALNQTFGLTKIGENTSHNLNFRTVPKAALYLFISAFGEGWDSIMDDFFVDKPYCSSINKNHVSYNDCGSQGQAYALFISWNILAVYLMMNLFVSIIVEAFKVTYHDNELMPQERFEKLIEKFKDRWKVYDKVGTGKIPFDKLEDLVNDFESNRLFTFDELSFKGWIKNDFREELAEKAVFNGEIDFHTTLLLVSYYNYFSKEKEYLRTFDDYVWRKYREYISYTDYDNTGEMVFISREERMRSRMGDSASAGIKRQSLANLNTGPDDLGFLSEVNTSLRRMGFERIPESEEREESNEEEEYEVNRSSDDGYTESRSSSVFGSIRHHGDRDVL
ncbi:unnamed protein product [Ambrosiozyma monospora]|uniref:Calcium-channel protein CCH1 n=1 Tax=Ambrosiozyma monospora TaxID=43982 RepID=A0A9W7DGW6_AMBMO|nr:unnamed protein product [Ambrosiozyma monospora]